MVTPRLHTQLTAGMAACALSVGLAAAPVAYSDSVIRTQKYVDVLGLDKVHAEDLDGEGVTIGLVDGHVDETVPELKGAKIEHKEYCDTLDVYAPINIANATAVASILVSPYYGWAPKATLINYGQPIDHHDQIGISQDCKDKTEGGRLLNQMLNDKVDVVVMPVGKPFLDDPTFTYALARAAEMGVPVVVAAGDDRDVRRVAGRASHNGVVAVGGADLKGRYGDFFSNRGEGLTVMAPGTDITMRYPGADGPVDRVVHGEFGTAYCAPMVAGALALAKQRWPDAHGNQLIHSLIKNAKRGKPGWNKDYGWGLLSIWLLINVDPSAYPQSNPLLAKMTDGNPSAQEIQDFRDGLVESTHLQGNDEYIYRGKDETAAGGFPPEGREMGTSPRYHGGSLPPSPSSSPSSDDGGNEDGPSMLRWIVGGGTVAVMLALAAVTVVMLRRRPDTPSTN